MAIFGPSAPFWVSNLGQYIYDFGSTSTTSASSMELIPPSSTHSRIPFRYILPSDILGRYIGLPSSQTMNVNVPPSSTIMRLSTQSYPQVTTMDVSQNSQTSTFNASRGGSFMASINIPNVNGHYSSSFSSHVAGGQYTPTLYNILGAIPSFVGLSGVDFHSQQTLLT